MRNEDKNKKCFVYVHSYKTLVIVKHMWSKDKAIQGPKKVSGYISVHVQNHTEAVCITYATMRYNNNKLVKMDSICMVAILDQSNFI